MFVGRSRELKAIRKELGRDSGSAILVYGRRRIGKTTLISEALKGSTAHVIRFTAVPDDLSENARRLSRAAGDAMGIPGLEITSFESVLKYIASTKEGLVLEVDEYQDLRRKKGEVVDAYFRDFIDYMPPNIKLIISGSAIRVMKGLLQKDNPLYQRFSLEIPLGELDYLEASLFYPERSIREKIGLYAVFGGIPMILSRIDPAASVEENIRNLLLSKTGPARLYAEDVLYSELRSTGGAYSAIVRIGNGKKSYSEIRASLGDGDVNSLEYTLEQLIKADFIVKKQPINAIGSRKRLFYELTSNLLRFHIAYIERNPSLASSMPAFYEKHVKPSIETFISYRFEEMARDWFTILAENGIRNDIFAVGTYWYDNPKTKQNGELDVAIETLSGYEIYEVKYLSSPMREKLISEETAKIRNDIGIPIASFGFISSSGFEKNGDMRISGERLFDTGIIRP